MDLKLREHGSHCTNYASSSLIKKVNKKRSHLVTDDNIIVACIHEPKELDYEIINNALERKTQRLNDIDYVKYDTNGLFIYNSGAFFFDNGTAVLNSKISELRAVYEKSFDYIFIYSDHDIVLMNVNSNGFERRKVTDDDVVQFQGNVNNSTRKL